MPEINNILFQNQTINNSLVSEWFSLCDSFMKTYEKESRKLPYHINLLDIFWAKENIHSRILAELFKQNNDQKFEVIESFITYYFFNEQWIIHQMLY